MPAKVINPYAYKPAPKKPDWTDILANISFKTVQRVYLTLTFIIALTLIFRNLHGKFDSSSLVEKEAVYDKIHLRRNDNMKTKKSDTYSNIKSDTLKPYSQHNPNPSHIKIIDKTPIVLRIKSKTRQPSLQPTSTFSPTFSPYRIIPSLQPTVEPSIIPSLKPTVFPSEIPTCQPITATPTIFPSILPTISKTIKTALKLTDNITTTSIMTSTSTTKSSLISVIWLRPSHGLALQEDNLKRRGQIKPDTGKYCWESIGELDDHSRTLLLTSLFGYHNQSSSDADSQHKFKLANTNSKSSMWLAAQKALDDSPLMKDFTNYHFKKLHFCYNSHSKSNSHNNNVNTIVRGIHGKSNNNTNNDYQKLKNNGDNSNVDWPVRSEFYIQNDNLSLSHSQISYPYSFFTPPIHQIANAINNMFSVKPIDTIYYFLIRPNINQLRSRTTDQCFFGSDRFGYFCIMIEENSYDSNNQNNNKIRIKGGFKSVRYSNYEPDINDLSHSYSHRKLNNVTTMIGYSSLVHDIQLTTPPSTSSTTIASKNVTILVAYRCKLLSSSTSASTPSYELSVSINGESFEILSTANLHPIPHPNLTITAHSSHSSSNKSSSAATYEKIQPHNKSFSTVSKRLLAITTTKITNIIKNTTHTNLERHHHNESSSSSSSSSSSAILNPLLNSSHTPPPPPTEYHWHWRFGNSVVLSTQSTFTSTSSRDINHENNNNQVSASAWGFSCNKIDCPSPWHIAEILIIEATSPSSSSSSSQQQQQQFLSEINGLSEVDIAGGFRHFRYKYHMGETLSLSTTPHVNHNSLPGTTSTSTNTDITTTNTKRVSTSKFNEIDISKINQKQSMNNSWSAHHHVAIVGSPVVPLVPHTDTVYSDCLPFHTHQIDQYRPPVNATAADVTRWKNEVDKVMKEIRGYKHGGAMLRKFMSDEAKKLQDIRDELFCSN